MQTALLSSAQERCVRDVFCLVSLSSAFTPSLSLCIYLDGLSELPLWSCPELVTGAQVTVHDS